MEMPVSGRPLVYSYLNGAEPAGVAIGQLGKQRIYDVVTDYFGKRYRYVGLAPRRWSGEIDVDALKDGEFILAPCLVYRLEPTKDTGGLFASLWTSVFGRRASD